MLRWTHYRDGSHSSATDSHTYTIYPDRLMGKYVLTIRTVGDSYPDRLVYKVKSLRAIMKIAQSHNDEEQRKYLTPATSESTVLSNTESREAPNPERD